MAEQKAKFEVEDGVEVRKLISPDGAHHMRDIRLVVKQSDVKQATFLKTYDIFLVEVQQGTIVNHVTEISLRVTSDTAALVGTVERLTADSVSYIMSGDKWMGYTYGISEGDPVRRVREEFFVNGVESLPAEEFERRLLDAKRKQVDYNEVYVAKKA